MDVTGTPPRGFTLVESLTALAVAVILLSAGHYVSRDLLPRQRVVAASNQVLGLIQRARARAFTHGPTLLCDGNSQCDRFDVTDHLVVAGDADGDGRIRPADVVEQLKLPAGTTLEWRRFRGQALRYGRLGNLYYQNGHFLICNQGQARRIVMTVMGTARIEPDAGSRCP
ncbi:Tfp pilus assembly protein FimT/FimU [Alloalcanivorax sp. C16-2]|uniref:pilus assembly FimT family protein n=1 Tax=Alloalcanivorax TaxID=3020832 RepID=UPI0019343296|nr:GspH/FimT family pseudopilin [Alloalcanivorax marinus]MBL7252272.1 prepilin-type N-terminal cleavage/methylation domain-containing protein [Alloalcanivorax marinus]